MAVFKFIN